MRSAVRLFYLLPIFWHTWLIINSDFHFRSSATCSWGACHLADTHLNSSCETFPYFESLNLFVISDCFAWGIEPYLQALPCSFLVDKQYRLRCSHCEWIINNGWSPWVINVGFGWISSIQFHQSPRPTYYYLFKDQASLITIHLRK